MSSASVSRLSVYIPYSKLLTEEIVFTFEGVNLDLVTSTSSFPLSPAAKLNASALSGSIIDENASKGGYAKDMDFVVAWIEQMISTVRFFFCACPLLPLKCDKLFLIPTLNLVHLLLCNYILLYPELTLFSAQHSDAAADNSGASRSERRNN